jgi:hypothetical protein
MRSTMTGGQVIEVANFTVFTVYGTLTSAMLDSILITNRLPQILLKILSLCFFQVRLLLCIPKKFVVPISVIVPFLITNFNLDPVYFCWFGTL